VLSNSGHGDAMVEWRCGNLKKCHQIAVALRVADGGAMAAAIAMAELRFFFCFLRDRCWADPTQP